MRQYKMMVMTMAVLAGLTLSSVARAAESATAPLKMGVVNMRDVFEKSQYYKSVTAKLQKEFEPKEKELNKQMTLYKNKTDALQKEGAVLSETEKAKQERDLATIQREIQRLQMEFREDSAARQQEEMQKFSTKIKTVMQSYGAEHQYDLIVHQEALVYSKDQYDLTNEVLKALDKATAG